MLQTYTAKLAERIIYNPKFQLLHFELVEPHRLAFTTGQYMLLNVPTTPQKKSYSIASSGSIDHRFDLLIDTAPQGEGTKYLTGLQPGEAITFMAPVGQFVLPATGTASAEAEKNIMFIATGSGIAPIKPMIEDLLEIQNDQRPIWLYWGLRFPQDEFWYDDFQLLSENHPNFVFHPVLSQAPPEWTLCRGRVTDCLTAHPQPPVTETSYYLCGGGPMVEEVNKLLLARGVPAEHIHREKFT